MALVKQNKGLVANGLQYLGYLLPAMGCLFLWVGCKEHDSSKAPLKHEVYLWQRLWDESVNQAVMSQGESFEQMLILAAEIDWRLKTNSATIIQPDFEALGSSQTPIGLVIRVPHFPKPSVDLALHKNQLISLAGTLIDRYSEQGIEISEMQLDLDCPDARLEHYIEWVKDLREAIEPMPFSITALPSWLNEPSFSELIDSVDHYVLQVHSIQPPTHREEALVLCDPYQARLAVERAGRWQTPFRVALPTYGYWMQWDTEGRFIRLSAETMPTLLQPKISLDSVMADPYAMADLVDHWQQSHPASMSGLIWFRMPVPSDRMNWRWETLSSVMQGKPPRMELTYSLKNPGPGYWEVWQEGTPHPNMAQGSVTVHWQAASLIAGDGLNGYRWRTLSPTSGQFKSSLRRTPPWGETGAHLIGWLRLDQADAVRLDDSL